MTDMVVIYGTGYLLAGIATATFMWHQLVDRVDSHRGKWATLLTMCVLAWPAVWASAVVHSIPAGRRWLYRTFEPDREAKS